MMFHAEPLRVVLATVHVPLADVPRLLTPAARRGHRHADGASLPDFGYPAPRIGLAGLNPHAGEHGLMGHEDDEVLRPVVAACRARGIDVQGPFPGDTVFLQATRGAFDVVVACYHDQGLIPVKLLAFGQSVNVTLGLPIVRTSVDHGTAFDIARPGHGRRLEPGRAPSSWRRGSPPRARTPTSTPTLKRTAAPQPHGHPPDLQPKSAPPKAAEKTPRLLADNRKAGFDFEYLEQFEAGVVLLGTEVKAIREGRVNLRDSYARVEGSEVWVYNVHISPYSHRGYADHEPLRKRKLLLNRAEIRKLIGRTVEKGLTLVPTRMYLKNGRVKMTIAPRPRQEGPRQARDHQAPRDGSRDAGGGQGTRRATVGRRSPSAGWDGGYRPRAPAYRR